MAKLQLREGEREVWREEVDVPVDGKTRDGTVIATSDRIVLVAGKPKMQTVTWWVFGSLGAFFRGLRAEPNQMTHQIARGDVAGAHVGDRKTVTVRSRGEGYGMIWFDVIPKEPAAFAARVHQWAANVAAQPLPVATLRKP